jgi:hypothetical protein
MGGGVAELDQMVLKMMIQTVAKFRPWPRSACASMQLVMRAAAAGDG